MWRGACVCAHTRTLAFVCWLHFFSGRKQMRDASHCRLSSSFLGCRVDWEKYFSQGAVALGYLSGLLNKHLFLSSESMTGSWSLLVKREIIMGRMVRMETQGSELQFPVSRVVFPSGHTIGGEEGTKSVVFFRFLLSKLSDHSQVFWIPVPFSLVKCQCWARFLVAFLAERR